MKLTPETVTLFLVTLAESCQVRKACDAAGISAYTAYRWRKEHPDFLDAWDEALKAGLYLLESEAHRRAFDGVDEPIYQQGVQVGTVRKYSDTLAMFLLKSHDPAKYRDNARMEVTGAEGGPVEFAQVDDAAAASRLATIMSAAQARKAQGDEGGE